MIDPYGHVLAWMMRMEAFGHGISTEMESGEAVLIAYDSTPRPAPISELDTGKLKAGDVVDIVPTDYGIDPTSGSLVTYTADEYVIRRVDPRAGEVFVHFPRMNYEIRKAGQKP